MTVQNGKKIDEQVVHLKEGSLFSRGSSTSDNGTGEITFHYFPYFALSIMKKDKNRLNRENG